MYAENPSPAFPLFELRACSHKLESRTAWEARRNRAKLGTSRAYMSTAVVKISAWEWLYFLSKDTRDVRISDNA
jgi:hypothetical protein